MSIKGILPDIAQSVRVAALQAVCHGFDSRCPDCGLLQVPHCVRESSKVAKLRIFAVVL